VSYAIHAEHKREGRKLIEGYRLTGSYGAGEAYDPAADQRLANRATLDLMRQGAASITSAASKKS
jgi:hypothetical protein